MLSTMGRVADGTITVLVVEDHRLVARGLASALETEDSITSVAVAGSIAEAESTIADIPVDVVLMDYGLPDGDGAEGCRRILAAAPWTRVVMLTAAPASEVLDSVLDAGCCGFVGKDSDIDELVAAVHAAANGDAYFSPNALAALVERRRSSTNPEQLTKREREILVLVADGRSMAAIATQLFLSVHTVRNHVRHIQVKLGAHSKLEAVVIAARRGIITFDPPSEGSRR